MTTDGFVFDDAYRVRGPGYRPIGEQGRGEWWHGSHQREEAAPRAAGRRGPVPRRDVLDRTGSRRGSPRSRPGPASTMPKLRRRPRSSPQHASVTEASCRRAKATSSIDRALAHAADQFIVAGPTRGGRIPVVRRLVARHVHLVRGVVPVHRPPRRRAPAAAVARPRRSPTGCWPTPPTSAADPSTTPPTRRCGSSTPLARHIEVTDDYDLAVELMPTVASIVDHHVAGTRYGSASIQPTVWSPRAPTGWR